jgi:hypothetical protein
MENLRVERLTREGKFDFEECGSCSSLSDM